MKNENEQTVIEQTNQGDYGINIGGGITNNFYLLCHCRFKKSSDVHDIESVSFPPLTKRNVMMRKVGMLMLLSIYIIGHFSAPFFTDWSKLALAIFYPPAGLYTGVVFLLIVYWHKLDEIIQENSLKLKKRKLGSYEPGC